MRGTKPWEVRNEIARTMWLFRRGKIGDAMMSRIGQGMLRDAQSRAGGPLFGISEGGYAKWQPTSEPSEPLTMARIQNAIRAIEGKPK